MDVRLARTGAETDRPDYEYWRQLREGEAWSNGFHRVVGVSSRVAYKFFMKKCHLQQVHIRYCRKRYLSVFFLQIIYKGCVLNESESFI